MSLFSWVFVAHFTLPNISRKMGRRSERTLRRREETAGYKRKARKPEKARTASIQSRQILGLPLTAKI